MTDQIERWDQLSVLPPDASVIDPRDTRGIKNQYIASLRNHSIVESLGPLGHAAPVLDFGCGTGGISRALVDSGRKVIGVDISPGLLRRARERALGGSALLVRYDGLHLPLADASFDAAVTYVVLTHIIDDAELTGLLREIVRVLRPGGRLVAVEQVRNRATIDLVAWQHRRTVVGFRGLFTEAGFTVTATTIVRYGRIPSIYAVRLGLVPVRAFPTLRALERWIGGTIGVLPWDYCDVRFELVRR